MRGETGDAELLTTREVAGLLRIKQRKVYDLVASGEIPHVRVTGKLLFPRALLDAWLLRHGEASAAAVRLPPCRWRRRKGADSTLWGREGAGTR